MAQFKTLLNLGDRARFQSPKGIERIIQVDEIRVTTMKHLPGAIPNLVLIEYREHVTRRWRDGSPPDVAGKWWPEKWFVERLEAA